MAELETGIKGSGSVFVEQSNTAMAMGSGTLPVFATPAMIALMEKTASESVQPYLEEGCGSVGTELKVKHTSATPLGMEVRCESELLIVDGRRLLFSVKAFDNAGLIGEGTHERFLIKNQSFLKKAEGKLG